MGDPVWVQQDDPEPGWWAAVCCDSRCTYGMHAVLETRHKAAAFAAAARHRAYLAALPEEDTGVVAASDRCEHCLQSPSAVRRLWELVRGLEVRLAVTEAACSSKEQAQEEREE